MSYGYTDAYAGEFYQPTSSKNLNTLINSVLTSPRNLKIDESAIIRQEVKFPDISFYQGTVNFGVMRLNTDAVILRIGQNLWKDDEFERNYIEAKKQGMKVGGYWFYDDRVSPRHQAELLLDCILGKTFEMEIYIDWERSYGGQFRGLPNVVAMMQLIDQAKAIGLAKIKGTGMYTGYYWFRGNSNPVANANQYNYLRGRPLWLAWYTSNPSNVLIPAPWTSLTIWQYGTPAINLGQQSSEIDMNWFNGTRQEFELRYGTLGEPNMSYMEIKSAVQGNHSIRRPTSYPQTPHIFGTSFATLEYPTTIHAEVGDFFVYPSDVIVSGVKRAQAGDKWWRVHVVGTEGWIAETHLGVKYTTVTLINTETPPTLPTLTIQISDTEGKYNPVTVTLTPK